MAQFQTHPGVKSVVFLKVILQRQEEREKGEGKREKMRENK